MPTPLRVALGAALLGAAIWLAWWPLAAWQRAAATEDWLEARRAEGWQAEWAAIDVAGFPLAYSRRIEAPALADPATGWAWQAPWLTLRAPRHAALSPAEAPAAALSPLPWGSGLKRGPLTVGFPPEQSLSRPGERLTLTAGALSARLDLRGARDSLRIATFDAEALGLLSEEGWRAGLGAARLTAVADPADPATLAVTLRAVDLTLPAAMAEAVRRTGGTPGQISRLAAEARIGFDRPWDQAALDIARPQPRRIDLRDAGLTWGALELRLAGDLTIAEDGTPEGRLLVKATNWRELLAAAEATGALPDALARTAEAALGLASRLAGSPDTLDVPLTFEGGRTRLGPLPLGPAPVLRLP
mgnify:CR=1 FL=1